MYPLTLCSVLALALIVERFLALRRGVVIPRAFLAGLHLVARDLQKNRESAMEYCRTQDSPISRILSAGIKRLPRGVVAAEKAIEDAGANEALKLRRNMRFLYALGSVATLLGLIGTISGMILAFQSAAESGSGRGDVQKLSEGIYEAMVNTFGGLAVAIVVTIFYYYFVGRIERLISEMNDTLARFADEFGFNDASAEFKVRSAE
jgi:biopolymer transport protein ExbB